MLNIISTRGQSDTKIMKWSFPKLPTIPLFLVASVVILVSGRKSSAHTYLSPPWEQARLKARVGRFHSIFNPIFITVDNSPPEWCCSSRLRKQMYNNSGHCIAKPAPTIGHCAPICSNSSYKTPAPLFRGRPPQLVMIWDLDICCRELQRMTQNSILPTLPFIIEGRRR